MLHQGFYLKKKKKRISFGVQIYANPMDIFRLKGGWFDWFFVFKISGTNCPDDMLSSDAIVQKLLRFAHFGNNEKLWLPVCITLFI